MSLTFRDRVRAFELALAERIDEFKCAVHLCLGQEDVPDALAAGLRERDWLFSTHRSHGHYLAKGGSAERLLAELEGKETGINAGFSGSQGFSDPSINFHSTAIVGGLIGAATGVAHSLKMDGDEGIVVCCLGDAATEQGVFWEALNYAALHRLPILFVVENNGLSVHAPLALRQSTPLNNRVRGFGLAYGAGITQLRFALTKHGRVVLPAVVEVKCRRESNHVSAMEDLRE